MTDIGPTSATISWGAASANGAPSVTYQVTGLPSCSAGTATSCVATGLSPFSSYKACVTATNSAGTGPQACSSQFSTPPVVEGSTLAAGQQLTPGEALVSSPAGYEAVLQSDGNVVVYDTSSNAETWSTQTTGNGGTQLAMQTDGNLVLSTASGTVVWQSATSGSHNYLTMQSDGNLVVYSSIGVPLWYPAGGDTGNQAYILPSNGTMVGGQTLYSPSGNYSLVMQTDGNLVEYTSGGAAVWNSGTSGAIGDYHVMMQPDGNLVVYNASNVALWNSGTSGNAGAYLAMQPDGNAVVYSSSNVALWSSQFGRAPTSTETAAVNWAISQIGSTAYDNRCLLFVYEAYQNAGVNLKSLTNFTAYSSSTYPQEVWSAGFKVGTTGGSNTTPPYGALVFFNASGAGANDPADNSHVTIMASNAEMISTPDVIGSAVHYETLTQVQNSPAWSTYVGWWLPDG